MSYHENQARSAKHNATLREVRETFQRISPHFMHFSFEHQVKPSNRQHNVLLALFDEGGLRRIIVSEINPGVLKPEQIAQTPAGTEAPEMLEMYVEAHSLRDHSTTGRRFSHSVEYPFPGDDIRVIADLSLQDVLKFSRKDLHVSHPRRNVG